MSLSLRLDDLSRWQSERLDQVRSQRGSSLVEALVAIMVMSVLLLGIMAGMTTTATVSRSTGQTARTRAALATVADRMSTLQFPGCATTSAVTDTVRSTVDVPTDYTATVTEIDYLVPAASSCTATTSVLKVTVEVSHHRTGTSVQGEVVLRDRSARPS